MKRFYPAIIDKGETVYGIVFPDFPGCVSVGETIEEAIAMGEEALAFHISGMIEDGDVIPLPTPLADVVPYDGVIPVMVVRVQAIIPDRAKRISITIDESLLDEIDSVSKNRSGFLANAARVELARLHNGA